MDWNFNFDLEEGLLPSPDAYQIPAPQDFFRDYPNLNELMDMPCSNQCHVQDTDVEKKTQFEEERKFIGDLSKLTLSTVDQDSSGSTSCPGSMSDEDVSRDGVVRFTCEECGKKFRFKAHLKQHRVKHQNDKPYKCIEFGCKKAYKTIGNLHRHLRSHSNEKKFECGGCGKTFLHKNKLKQHMMNKHGESIFHRCQLCVKNFIEEKELHNHLLTRHYLFVFT